MNHKDVVFIGIYIETAVLPFLKIKRCCDGDGCLLLALLHVGAGREAKNIGEL